MARINIIDTPADEYGGDPGDPVVIGWFDGDKADCWGEARDWDGSNKISRNTRTYFRHQMLYRTAGGRWVRREWSIHQGDGLYDRYSYLDAAAAEAWLRLNDQDEALAAHFGPDPEEAGPGTAGATPLRNIRVGDDLWRAFTGEAAARGLTASELLRDLMRAAVGESA